MANFKKCIYISGIFIVVGLALIIFGIVMEGLIKGQATDEAQMKEENSGTWAYIPGDTEVEIYKDHYFYNIENLEDIFFKKGKAKATEMGPYRVQEFDEMINRTYSDKNETVSFRLWRYYKNPSEADGEKQEKDEVTTVNLPSLGVWYQAKNAKPSQVALKALYVIYQALTNDFYYGAIQTALDQLPHTMMSVFQDDIYFSADFKNQLIYDPNYGLNGTNNAMFIKAVMTHPSNDSQFLMDYWGLKDVEMHYFKLKFEEAWSRAFKNDTKIDLAAKQWLDLSVNQGNSIADKNITSPGYLEYGAYLKFVAKKPGKSSITYDQAKTLFFDFNDIGRSPRIDDTHCLINKVNLEQIFNSSKADAIDFIDKQMNINNKTESEDIYGYLVYIVEDLGWGLNRRGTPAIAAIADFLSQGLWQIFNSIGWDSFLGLLQHDIYTDLQSKKASCTDILNQITLPTVYDTSKICANSKLDITKVENVPFWVQGVLYRNKDFKTLLDETLDNIPTDLDYAELTQDDSKIVLYLSGFAEKIIAKYGAEGNYKAPNLMPMAAAQWLSGNVTQTGDSFAADTIKKWDENHYKQPPEYYLFCKHFGYEVNIDLVTMKNITNFDYLFSSKWISDRFIEYTDPKIVPTPFNSKQFIDYLRFVMIYEVLGFFTKKSVKDLMWGYEDPLLKLVNETNYFMGGDRIPTNFSLLNNMWEPPEEGNEWSMYTGVDNYTMTRQFKTVSGSDRSIILMREPYFDGKEVSMRIRNPWKGEVPLNGTDALSFAPQETPENVIWAYLDDLYRTTAFKYNSTKNYHKLKAYRFL